MSERLDKIIKPYILSHITIFKKFSDRVQAITSAINSLSLTAYLLDTNEGRRSELNTEVIYKKQVVIHIMPDGTTMTHEEWLAFVRGS